MKAASGANATVQQAVTMERNWKTSARCSMRTDRRAKSTDRCAMTAGSQSKSIARRATAGDSDNKSTARHAVTTTSRAVTPDNRTKSGGRLAKLIHFRPATS